MAQVRILHLVEDLRVGGLEKTILSIAVGLDKSKYEVEIWCLARGGEIAEQLTQDGITVRVLGLTSYHNPFRILELVRLFRRQNIDLLHTHGYFASTFGRIAAILARVPIIVTHVQSTYFHFKKRNRIIERVLSCFTNKIICISLAVQRFVVETEGIRKARTCLIYNAANTTETEISSESIAELRAESGFHSEDIVMIIVASLTANKGHSVLLDALSRLADKYAALKLIVVGDGPLRGALQSYAAKLDLSFRVCFAGQKSDVFRWLKTADFFVLPSVEREGLGIALIEAMAAGLPVIGTRVGGIPELIEHNVSGLLVAPGDAHDLASAIEALSVDPVRRRNMGGVGREIYLKKFTFAKMIQEVESLYDQLILERLG